MPNEESKDWGNVRFRPQAHLPVHEWEGNADFRFRVGVTIFLATALAYPWYAYWVQSRLLARDVEQAAAEVGRQLQADTVAMERQARLGAVRGARADQRTRITQVRVMGVMRGSGSPTVIVDLGGANLADAASPICLQAAERLGQSTAGMTFNVQRYRRNAPGGVLGSISC